MNGMSESSTAILLFRDDLRIADNAALTEASKSGANLICLYVWDDRPPFAIGDAQRWWLHHSLVAHSTALRKLGSPLNIRVGKTEEVVAQIVAQTNADSVFWNRRYVPHQVERDKALMAQLRRQGCTVTSCKGRLLAEPWDTLNKDGNPYRVFTAFWKCLQRASTIETPLYAPTSLAGSQLGGNATVDELGLISTESDWSEGFHQHWQPGEDGGHIGLEKFLDFGVYHYGKGRDFPSLAATSRLSPHLQMGEVSPRQILHAAAQVLFSGKLLENDFKKLHSELAWRDFNSHLLYYFPDLTEQEFRPYFRNFPWQNDREVFSLWTRGQTGYPIVDAGMRELWQTGYMHNRVRMITASFLTKPLLQDWRCGMHWFWDTLLDADLASNTLNWQWVAGCGADAAPYFRIFNPMLQAVKFDSEGSYVRKWVPEIAALPTRYLDEPSSAPPPELAKAGIKLGKTYPLPMVDHKFARDRALATYNSLKESADQKS